MPVALLAFLRRWWKAGLGIILGALLIWPLAQCQGERDGKRKERAAWELRVERLKAIAEQQQRQADALRRAAEALDRTRIDTNRREVDDATRNIPDQGLTPRQRARACLELRRRGQTSPACEPQPAR